MIAKLAILPGGSQGNVLADVLLFSGLWREGTNGLAGRFPVGRCEKAPDPAVFFGGWLR
jgi:hypothetical protein